jgi:hypothetical protein
MAKVAAKRPAKQNCMEKTLRSDRDSNRKHVMGNKHGSTKKANQE